VIFEQNSEENDTTHDRTPPVSLKFEQSSLQQNGKVDGACRAEISQSARSTVSDIHHKKLLMPIGDKRPKKDQRQLVHPHVVVANRFGLYTNGKLIDKLPPGKDFAHEYLQVPIYTVGIDGCRIRHRHRHPALDQAGSTTPLRR
jgi:hypothetical protein